MVKKFLTAGFIIALVGGAAMIFLINGNDESKTAQGDVGTVILEEQDHFLGSRLAPVKIVEYAEVECSYCKKLHPVLLRILSEYAGQVSFVYRHFPLTIHPKSFDEALALECIAAAKGDDAFYAYLNRLFATTPSDNKIDLLVLPKLAKEQGLSEEWFTDCVSSERHIARVRADITTGFNLGVDSVPHLIVISPSGKEFVFGKSPSYAALNAVIETALNEK